MHQMRRPVVILTKFLLIVAFSKVSSDVRDARFISSGSTSNLQAGSCGGAESPTNALRCDWRLYSYPGFK